MNLFAYIPAVVGFAAALVAIIGKPKWNSKKFGFRKLTPVGWFTAVLATVALGTSLYLTWKTQVDLEKRRNQTNEIRKLAHTELRLGIQSIVEEFIPIVRHVDVASEVFRAELLDAKCGTFPVCMLDASIKNLVGEVTSPRTRRSGIRYTHEELMADPALVREHNALDFISTTQYRIEWHATEGVEHIDRTLQTYATYLEPEILLRISQLRRSDYLWVLLRLDRPFREAAEADRSVGATYEPNAYGYDNFWTTVVRLLEDEERGGLFRDGTNQEIWKSAYPFG